MEIENSGSPPLSPAASHSDAPSKIEHHFAPRGLYARVSRFSPQALVNDAAQYMRQKHGSHQAIRNHVSDSNVCPPI
jgi:hypothetical protein